MEIPGPGFAAQGTETAATRGLDRPRFRAWATSRRSPLLRWPMLPAFAGGDRKVRRAASPSVLQLAATESSRAARRTEDLAAKPARNFGMCKCPATAISPLMKTAGSGPESRAPRPQNRIAADAQ